MKQFWELISRASFLITGEVFFVIVLSPNNFRYVFISLSSRKLRSFRIFLVWWASRSWIHFYYFLIVSFLFFLLFYLFLLEKGWQVFTFFFVLGGGKLKFMSTFKSASSKIQMMKFILQLAAPSTNPFECNMNRFVVCYFFLIGV